METGKFAHGKFALGKFAPGTFAPGKSAPRKIRPSQDLTILLYLYMIFHIIYCIFINTYFFTNGKTLEKTILKMRIKVYFQGAEEDYVSLCSLRTHSFF